MIDERDDEDLERRFRELRAHDRLHVPAFSAVVESSRAIAARRARLRPLRWAAAAVFVIAAGGVVVLVHRLRPQPVLVAIGSWQSPTDWLLRVSGPVRLDSVPSVTASLVQVGDPFAVNVTSRRSGRSKGDTI